MTLTQERLKAAYEHGQRVAKALHVGGEFYGSMPEAAKHYEVDSLEYLVFETGYLEVVKQHEIWVNPDTGLISGFKRVDKANP